jgi:hypothetical protein
MLFVLFPDFCLFMNHPQKRGSGVLFSVINKKKSDSDFYDIVTKPGFLGF